MSIQIQKIEKTISALHGLVGDLSQSEMKNLIEDTQSKLNESTTDLNNAQSMLSRATDKKRIKTLESSVADYQADVAKYAMKLQVLQALESYCANDSTDVQTTADTIIESDSN